MVPDTVFVMSTPDPPCWFRLNPPLSASPCDVPPEHQGRADFMQPIAFWNGHPTDCDALLRAFCRDMRQAGEKGGYGLCRGA
jgi:hypothetical protein